jgi:hypothetical protein
MSVCTLDSLQSSISNMPTPSLILVPARFKTGKLYTPLATTSGGVVLGASGDFNVTRATTATRVNANGLIESVASGVPRLDYYTSGGTAGCPALLVEPQAQNTCLQSETFQSWSFTNASGSSGNVGASPSNTQTAGLFIPNSGTTGRGDVACGTLSNATTYSYSCFIKTPTNSLTSVWLYLSDGGAGSGANRWGVEVNLTNFTLTDYIVGNGSVTSKAVENYGNGWYRIRVTGQVTSAISGSSVAVVRKVTAGADTNGINGVLVWGFQVETGSVATSYIPTTTAAVTRNADEISRTSISGCIGQTEGTIYAELDFSRAVLSMAITLGNGSSEGFRIRKTLNFGVLVQAVNTPSGAATLFTSPAASAGIYKIAFGYKNGDYAMSINGAAVQTSPNSANFPVNALDRLLLGETIGGVPYFNDRMRAVALYTTRLTNAELQSLTTL